MLNGKLILRHKETAERKELIIKNLDPTMEMFSSQIKKIMEMNGLSTQEKDMDKWIVDYSDIK